MNFSKNRPVLFAIASLALYSSSSLGSSKLHAQSYAAIIGDKEEFNSQTSDGKDNGGNLSFEEVKKQVREIQRQLRLELFIARTSLSFNNVTLAPQNDLSRIHPNRDQVDLIPIEALERVLDSFDDAIIIPTSRKLSVEASDTDSIETIRIEVDAINNSHRYDIQINIYSWALLDWCKKAQLVLHEHMGLENVEKSLEYNHSSALISQTSFCKQNGNSQEF